LGGICYRQNNEVQLSCQNLTRALIRLSRSSCRESQIEQMQRVHSTLEIMCSRVVDWINAVRTSDSRGHVLESRRMGKYGAPIHKVLSCYSQQSDVEADIFFLSTSRYSHESQKGVTSQQATTCAREWLRTCDQLPVAFSASSPYRPVWAYLL
jgi:hypothetical protein